MRAQMNLGKEKLIPIFAMIVLLIGTFSAIYVNATQVDKDTITINGKEYTIGSMDDFADLEMVGDKIIAYDRKTGEKTGEFTRGEIAAKVNALPRSEPVPPEDIPKIVKDIFFMSTPP